MKKLLTTIMTALPFLAFAQWSQSGSIIYYNTGNVGIGTTSPQYNLDITGTLRTTSFISANQYVTVGNGGSYRVAMNGQADGYLTGRNASNQDMFTIAAYGNSYFNGGNVGIGTNSPTTKLEVVGPSTGSGVTVKVGGGGDLMLNNGGSVFFDGNYSYASGSYIRPVATNTQGFFTNGVERLRIASDGFVSVGTGSTYGKLSVGQTTDAADQGIGIVNSTGVRAMRLWADPNNSYVYSGITGQANLILNGTGNVGVGTTSPNEKFTVNGKVYAKEVKVDLNVPGPDYVFEENYPLQSLKEVETYIKENNHLPEVPSAKEMKENGISVGEMNMILLRKLEELTLHLIEKEKEIQDLRTRIVTLENKTK